MPINCTDCQGELDPAYFDTHCRDCDHDPARHIEANTLTNIDGHCNSLMNAENGLIDGTHWCACGEYQQPTLRCESCEARARNQASYDNLTPWQQWNR